VAFSAAPNQAGFVDEALRAIDDAARVLADNRATAFEARFRNPVADPSWDFSRVRLCVRYVNRQENQ